MPIHTDILRFILILFSYLCLGFPSGLFPSGLPKKTLHAPLLSPTRAKTFFSLRETAVILQYGENGRRRKYKVVFYVTLSLRKKVG
jgi:hypothetical protein